MGVTKPVLIATINIVDVMIDGIAFAPKLVKRDVEPDNQGLLFYNAVQEFLIGFRATKPAIPTAQKVTVNFYDNGRNNADIRFEFEPEIKTDTEFENSISQSVQAVHMILKKLRETATTSKTKFTKSGNAGVKVKRIVDPSVN